MSVRVACAAFGISETCYRYQAKHSAANIEIADWLIKLTHNQRNWGYPIGGALAGIPVSTAIIIGALIIANSNKK